MDAPMLSDFIAGAQTLVKLKVFSVKDMAVNIYGASTVTQCGKHIGAKHRETIQGPFSLVLKTKK